MTIVESGKTREGKPCKFYMDETLRKNLDVAKLRVGKKNWDYVCIISGLPGAGKSMFARQIARYCCPWFDENYIAWRDQGREGGVKGFIDITTNCPEYSAVILDESFASLNSRIGMTPEFLKVVNHLQIIRQKHLFLILCLPNFFDLSKGVAIFRSSHLFVTYAKEDGTRGYFTGFDRNGKRNLFIKGSKFINYNAQRANMKGRFTFNDTIVPESIYNALKLKHLNEQQAEIDKKMINTTQKRWMVQRDEAFSRMRYGLDFSNELIGEIFGIDESSVRRAIEKMEIRGYKPTSINRKLFNMLLKLVRKAKRRRLGLAI